jgi:hypothetical protein
MAIKVDDETIERDLPPELCAMKTRAAQALPEHVLGPHLPLAQSAREFMPLGGHWPSSPV